MKDFEQIPHTADIKIRVYGATKQELFVNALVGMFQVLGPHITGARKEHGRVVCDALPITRTIEVSATDQESLLVDFLSEAVYLSDVHNEVYLAATIDKLSDTVVLATVHGIGVNGFDVVEIKAVTYHDLAIEYKNGVWQTDIVFDI